MSLLTVKLLLASFNLYDSDYSITGKVLAYQLHIPRHGTAENLKIT